MEGWIWWTWRKWLLGCLLHSHRRAARICYVNVPLVKQVFWKTLWLPSSWDFPCGSAGKESTCNAGDLGSIPGLGRSPGEGKGHPLQYSGLANSMDHTVCGVPESDTTERLSLSLHCLPSCRAHMHVLSHFSHVLLFATLWTVAHQAPLSMRFSSQKYWGGFPCPLPEDRTHVSDVSCIGRPVLYY